MASWEVIVESARSCQTKQTWEQMFRRFGADVGSAGTSRPLAELFRMLRNDPQSLQYDPYIWSTLIKGCLSSWDLVLGAEIADFCDKISCASVKIPAATVHLEAGRTERTREIARRVLRLSGLLLKDRIQTEMLIANSYAEENKHSQSVRIMDRLASLVREAELGDREKAEFLSSMGRMHYIMGRYERAGAFFREASVHLKRTEDWEALAKCLFNTAACYQNCGGGAISDGAFQLVEECRRISTDHRLPGPLSHCDAFYGLEAFHQGDFAAAKEHFRKALEHLPPSEQGYRRLHVVSMLAHTYFEAGQYHQAKKYSTETMRLAAIDESSRFRSRYDTLEALLLWEDGRFVDSFDLLRKAIVPFAERGVITLEELSTLAEYYRKAAFLGVGVAADAQDVTIGSHLSRNHYSQICHTSAKGFYLLSQRTTHLAEVAFNQALTDSKASGNRQHEAVALLGLIQVRLCLSRTDDAEALLPQFQIAVARLGESTLLPYPSLVLSAISYQKGNLEDTKRYLKQSLRSPRTGAAEKFVMGCWLATIEGRSPRLSAPWQQALVGNMTRNFFAPSIHAVSEGLFVVSDRYEVDMSRYPALVDLLQYLLRRSTFSATDAELQTEVWKQSLRSLGWQQKIRNSITRLRGLFPYTVAPLLIHADTIRVFREAVRIDVHSEGARWSDEDFARLVRDRPMSSHQLSTRLQVSLATTKRVLKRLADSGVIRSERSGRNIVYTANTDT